MGLFNKVFKAANKVKNKDIMEAIVAGCLLIAAADGEIEASEIEKMGKLISANESLSAFKSTEINATIQRFTNLLEVDFGFGKKKILDELADIADDRRQCEDVLLSMMAIAKANGKIEDVEKSILLQVANTLRLNPADFDLT